MIRSICDDVAFAEFVKANALKLFAETAKAQSWPIASHLNIEATEESRAPASGSQEHVIAPRGPLFQRPFFFGYFSFWAVQKESNPAAFLADGTPNVVRQIALNPQAKRRAKALDPRLRGDDGLRAKALDPGVRRDDGFKRKGKIKMGPSWRWDDGS